MAYSSIVKPTDYFETKLYTGNGGTQSITGVEFQPDLVWIKNRSTTDWHWWNDAVRGATKTLHSNKNNAESTESTSITGFTSDGFSLGSEASTNGSGNSIVAWNWKAGTGQGSSNTDGSINTTYTSVNTTAGFSISQYTGTGSAGATVGHGLGAIPKWIIVKKTSGASGWHVYHDSLGNTQRISLNETDATSSDSSAWNNTTPTSSVFTIGNSSTTNGSSATTIAYCFAEKKGYSKFGKYTGNGNVDGTFVYTGFKPAFVIIKNTGATKNWYLFDNKRETFNAQDSVLYPNLFNAETSVSDYNSLDFLSNGFKLRGGSSGVGDDTNGSYTYIYMAFAENPFVGNDSGTAVPGTAR